MLQLPTTKEIPAAFSAGAPSVESTDCPVLALALEYEGLVLANNRADNLNQDDVMRRAELAMDAVADKASRLSAVSVEGATFQIMLAAAMSHTILCGSTKKVKEDAFDLTERLLHRAIDQLKTDDGLPATTAFLLPRTWRPGVAPTHRGETR